MSPRPKQNVRKDQRERDQHREELERRAEDWLNERPELAREFTAASARQEPYHRWLSYRQGFAPGLVRRFLAEAAPLDKALLDPFGGSGTFPIECARAGRFAVAIEASPGLARVAAAPWCEGAFQPPSGSGQDLARWMEAATTREARALVLACAAERADGEGHERREAVGDPAWRLAELAALWTADRASPLTAPSGIVRGDARALPLKRGSIGGVLTSPPYLSRYDYARVNAPLDRLIGVGKRKAREPQMRASKATADRERRVAPHPAAEEAAAHLEALERPAEAALVRGYVLDLSKVVSELARVCGLGAPVWMVIGGAAPRRVYLPADLIAADLMAQAGFAIESVDIGRRLHGGGRALGTLRGIAPREVLIRARRASDVAPRAR